MATLRVGVVSMALTLALAAAAALYVGLRDSPTAAAPVPAAETTAEPVPRDTQPEDERPEDTRSEEAKPEGDRPGGVRSEGAGSEGAGSEGAGSEGAGSEGAGSEGAGSEGARSEDERPEEAPREPEGAPLASEPISEEGWQRPTEEERAAANGPRRYAPVAGAALTLTIPALQVHDAPVLDSDSPEALAAGVAHIPETSMPWDGGAQRNVYLAAHRIGYSGSESRLLFYRLNELGRGDEVILEGRGRTYRYRVSEKLVVDPTDSWVMGQVRGRDMISLQTCTPIPTFEKRLVVRADRH